MDKKPIIRYFDRGVWYDATVSDIGNLEDLNTVHKTTVVEAINDIVGGNINISGELLEKLTALDNNISRIDGLIASGSLNETQANQMNQFVTNKLNELNQSMEELNKQRDQRLKEQEEKVAQLKLDSESDKQRIEEITGDLNATKEKLNNAELNVTSVTQLVDEINGKISQAVSKTDFDLLEGTVREQKTLIDQTAEGIKLLATKEELDKSNENVKSIKSALDVQAGLIESKVSSEQLINEMEKIDKYMPNLLRYTRNWQDWENNDEANIDVTLNEYRDCIIQRARGIGKGLSTTVEDLEIGETYSLSVWVKHDDTNAKLYAMVDNEEIIMTDLNSKETFVGNEFKRMRCSFVAKDTTAKVRFIFKNCRTDSYGYLAGAKCEKSKKVSGWQPHSEDVYQSIKSARSEIKQTDNKITTLVETVNKQGDLITSHKTSIDETDKAIKLQAESIKTLGESIEKTQADLKVASDKITSKVWKADVGEMISDINIDNKNRVLNSDFGDGWKLWSETNNLFQLKQIGNYKFAVAERSGLSQNIAIAIATNKFPVKHNERLMFGFYFYCANLSKLDNKIVGALELLDINDIRIDRVDFDVSKLSLENGSFTKLTDTYFVEDERIVKARLRFFLNRNGNVGFALPMVQGGDIKSSDWSLAPEDVARRFNDTNVTIANYEQTVNGFKQTVESYKGSVDGYSNQVSEFNQTVNGFSQNIKDYKESNDKRVQQLETSLTTESGKIEAVVKESAGTKDELGKLTANGGRISQLELTAQGLKSTVASQTSSISTIQTDTTNAKQLANDALSKAQNAVTSATNASSTASSAYNKASDASSVANSANQNATNAVASANTAVSKANTAKSNADKAIADVASLTKTVSSHSTKIDQTSNRIDLVASGVTEVGNRLDNLQVGGRNLLKDTANFGNKGMPSGGKDGWLHAYDSSIETEKYNGLTVRSLKNVSSTKTMCQYKFTGFNLSDTYTLSFWAKGTIDKFRCYFYGDNGFVGSKVINASIPHYSTGRFGDGYCEFVNPKITNWTRISVTWELNSVGDINILKYVLIRTDYATGGDLYVCGLKLEKGNKATDWTPAPEDQQSQIDGINNNLSNNYFTKEQTEAAITVKADSITQTVSSTYATKNNTIKSTVEEFYQSTSPTSLSGGSWSTTQPTWVQGKYIWRRTKNTYGNNSVSYTPSTNGVCITGNTGATGATGQKGNGISSTIVSYGVSSSGTTPPVAWQTTVPTVSPSNYLWTRTVLNFTDGTSTTSYSVGKIGEQGPAGTKGDKGDRGNDGLPGKDGVGLKSTVITYGLSSSDTTQPTSWGSQVPTLTKGKFLWTKTVWTYTDSTSEASYQKTYIARDGNDGTDGLPGKDGVGIKSTTITYAVSTSGTTKPTSGWSAIIPSVSSGQYLWTRTVWTYTDDTAETGYSVSMMGERGPQGLEGAQGPKGDQGIQGRPGADGRTSYAHIAYADSADGTKNFSVSDSNRLYIGFYTDFNATDSAIPSNYRWSLIKGADGQDGADGVPGKPGVDGRTPYFHTAYANSADGSSGFSTTDSNGKLYLGTCTDYSQTDPTNYRVYTWVKIKGDKGDQGVQGPKGENGQSLYTWLKYADDVNGNGMSETPDGKKYIGLAYNKTVSTESSNPKDYTWSLIQGKNGVNGADGKTYYTWVKYADSATGAGMSDSPSGKSYIGLAYNKTTSTESTNPSDYSWSLIKGGKGDTGATLYTWVKYADNASGGGLSDSANGKKYIGIAYNKATATESTNPADYTWSLIQGPQGAQGPAGQNGKGVSSYSVTYQAGTSGTTVPTGTWTTTIPTVPKGQYLWTKMVITYTDNTSSTSYSVSYIPVNGPAGATGATGNGVSSIITEFYLSTSKTTQTGGSWSTTQPTWSPGKYVWTRNKITYTNGSTAYTSPQCSSEWEAVNNIHVGGRNLYAQSANNTFAGDISNHSDTSRVLDSYGFKSAYNASKAGVANVRLQQLQFNGITYATVSFDAYVNTGTLGITVDICDYVNKGYNISTTKTRYSLFVDNISRYNTPTSYNGFVDFMFTLKEGQTFYVENVMVEHATTPSSHTPAPEDMATAEDVSNLTKTVNTKIEQTSGRIDLVARSVTEVGNKLDNLQIGGRNLLTKDILSKFRGNVLTNNKDGSITTTFYYQNDSALTNLKAGDTFTFSCKLKKEGDFAGKVRIGIFHDGAWDSYYMGSLLTKDYKMFSKTITMKKDGAIGLVIQNDNGASVNTEKITFKELKLEIGNKATDYSPAPEDQQSQIDGINSNLSNNYYQKTTVDSKISTATSGITAQYTKDISTRLGNYYDKSTIDSKLTIDGTGISSYVKSTQSQINGINNNLSNNYYQKTVVDSKLSTAVSGITAQYTKDINTRLGSYYDKSTIDSKLTIDGTGISTYVKSTKSRVDSLNTQYTQVKQLADRISSTVYDSASGLVTKTNQLAGKYAIKQLNSAGDILTSLNLNANTSTAEINAKLIRLNGYTKMDDAFINKLVANSIVTNKIKSTEISGNIIKGGTIQGVKIISNNGPGNVVLNNGRIDMDLIEHIEPNVNRNSIGTFTPSYITMASYIDRRSTPQLDGSVMLDYTGFTSRIKDDDGTIQDRRLEFNSEGFHIYPISASSYALNSGIRLFGRYAYLDLNGNKTTKTKGTVSRIISNPDGGMLISNSAGNIYLETKNGAQPMANGYKIPYTWASDTEGIRYLRIVRPGASNAYIETANNSRVWGISIWLSDQRLKSNITTPTQDALSTINQLQVRQFDWKSDNVHEDFGLVAQEVEQVLPNAVFKVGDYYQIKDSGLIPVLIGAVQKLSNKVNLLENIIYNTKGGNLI